MALRCAPRAVAAAAASPARPPPFSSSPPAPLHAPRTPPSPAPTHPTALTRQLIKVRVANPGWDAERVAAHAAAGGGSNNMVYAMRLKGSAKVNKALARQGLAVDVRYLGAARAPPPVAAAAAAVAAEAAAAVGAPAAAAAPLQ